MKEADFRMVELYRDFLPKKVFDAHMHLYLGTAIPKFRGPHGQFPLEKATPADYCADMLPLMPGVEQIRLNMMPMPDPILNATENGLRESAHDHIRNQLSHHSEHIGSAYVLPGDTEEDIAEMLSRGMRGLKPYCYGSGQATTGNSRIAEFLPEAAWVVSNQTGTPIVLHMMRTSLADRDNLSYICRMAQQYPNAPLVLAHCGRGFAAWTAVCNIPKLPDRENIWFDMSAVCEVGPMMAAIAKTGGKRIMWGSDWPICMKRGRAISMVDDQLWVTEANISGGNYAILTTEALLAFYQTALLMNLDQTQIDDIFYNNAARLFDKN